MTNPNPSVLQCHHLAKQFTDGGLNTQVLNDINLSISKGDRIAIVGSSGSGKSTLLHLLGGLDEPTRGTVEIHGKNINKLSVNALSKLRNQSLGFVYQFHHLLPEFTAVENVAIPLVIGGVKPEFENIADGSYPVSRALYVYIKKEHLTIRPSIKTFVEIYMSDEAAGEFGYLADRGLIPMPKDELDLARELISIDIK